MAVKAPKPKEEELLVQPEEEEDLLKPDILPEIEALEQTTLDTTAEIQTVVSPDVLVVPPVVIEDTFFGAEDAAQFGADLPLDWQLKITPEGQISVIDPGGWEFLEGDLFISPEGTPLTLAQVEFLFTLPEEQRILEFPTLPQAFPQVEAIPEAPVTDRIAELEAQLTASVDLVETLEIEKELTALRTQVQTQEALGVVFPEQEISEIAEFYFPKVEEIAIVGQAKVEEQQALAKERFNEFIDVILATGKTPETEALLKTLDPSLTDEEITQFFTQPRDVFVESQVKNLPLVKLSGVGDAELNALFNTKGERSSVEAWVVKNTGRPKDDTLVQGTIDQIVKLLTGVAPPPNLIEQAQLSFVTGWGNVISGAAGTAGWLGFEGVAENLSEIGADLQENRPPNTLGEFNIADLLNPEFYATKIAEAIPFAMALAPLAISGFYGGSALAIALGAGKVVSWIIGGLGGAALSRPAESALEAGSQYDDAIARGKSPKEAREEANEVFRNNLLLAGADAWEIAIALAPTPKWVPAALIKRGLVRTVVIAGKVVIVGLSEGGEELFQDWIQRHARGEDWKLDPVGKEVFAIGFMLGGGMAISGDVIANVANESKSKMTPEQLAEFGKSVTESKKEGFTTPQAELKALDVVAQTPEGAEVVGEAIETVKEIPVEVTPTEVAPVEEVTPTEVAPTEEVAPILTPPTAEVFQEQLKAELAPPTEIRAEVTAVKEPWQMTQSEWLATKPRTTTTPALAHLKMVSAALEEGKPVPAKVLKDYPSLVEVTETLVTPRTVTEFHKELIDWFGVAKVGDNILGILPDGTTIKAEGFGAFQHKGVGTTEQWLNTGVIRVVPEEGGNISVEIKGEITDAQKEVLVKLVQDTGGFIRIDFTDRDGKTIQFFEGSKQDVGVSLNNYLAGLAKPPAVEVTPPVTEVAKPAVEVAPPIKPPTTKGEIVETVPTPEGAAGRVLRRIELEPAEVGVKEKIRQGFHRFNVMMVDDLYAVKKFTEQATKGGVELAIEENPYLLSRLLKGVTSKATTFLTQGTFGKKFWKIEGGKAVPDFTGESLEAILKQVSKPEQWQDFSAYLVARRAIQLSERNIETGISLADAQAAVTELESKYKGFNSLAERVYAYQDKLLVYAQEMGLLSKDLLTKLRKHGDYVPFYRVFNELAAKGFMGKKMANIASPIKKIKGSEREIINPLESIVKNTYTMVNAADRNQVGIAMANLVDQNPELSDLFERVKVPMTRVAQVSAKELGVAIEGLSDEDADAVVDIFRPSFFVKGDEVTVLLDGKKAYYKIDPDLRDALLTLDRESIGLLGKVLGYPTKWLRAGATLSPDFMVRNPLRDQMSAFAYSNYGFLPGFDFLKGVAGILKKDADYKLFKLSGAEHSMLVSMDREYTNRSFKEIVEGKKFKDYIKHPLELFQIVSELGEKATRLGEFKAGIRRGAVPLEAGFSARAVTLDFAQAGTSARSINRIIAFFNANIRGTGKMISSFKEHPTRTAAKVFIGITLPSILLYLANRDDPRWKEIPQWQKDLFWIIMTKDNIYRIPKPFELGILFGSVPERFLEWLDNRDPKMLKDVMRSALEAGSPGFIPTALLPIMENLSNYNFFLGRAIVPASRQDLPPELQYTRWTSEVSKKLGELLDMSPSKIDNLINGWTGGLGRYTLDILGAILKGTGISPDITEPSPTLADLPVIKSFVVRNPYGSSGKAVNDFYNLRTEYTEGEKFLKEMLSLGEIEKFEEYKAAHPELLFFYDAVDDIAYSASARYLRRVASQLSELGKKQDVIFHSKTLSPEEKRTLIDEIDKLKTDVARRALDLFLGDIPEVLPSQLNDDINKLGQLDEDIPELLEPEFFDMKNLNTEFGRTLSGVTLEELNKLENIDPLAFAFVEKEKVEDIVNPIPNKTIYQYAPDLAEGVTFEEYFTNWQAGLVTDETLDNLTRQQRNLLREYNSLTPIAQVAFLEEHPELKDNPRDEWLKAHPKENAQLAIWGQADVLTLEAYDEVKRLIDELDIPSDAVPKLTLPPEESKETHFDYLASGEEFGWNSWETQLILANDPAYSEWRGLQPIDTPVASLELKVKNRKFSDEYAGYSDSDSPFYILNKEAREEARDQFKTDNPEWVDDTRRIEAIENNASDETIEEWVDRGKTADEFGGGSSEAKVWLLDHPDTHKWAIDQGLLTDDGSDWNEQVLRINVEWAEWDDWYDSIEDIVVEGVEFTAKQIRVAALKINPDYAIARTKRNAYREGVPENLIDLWVEYYSLPLAGKARDNFLRANPEYYTTVWLGILENKPI